MNKKARKFIVELAALGMYSLFYFCRNIEFLITAAYILYNTIELKMLQSFLEFIPVIHRAASNMSSMTVL